jgi:hypothetical protein
VNDFRGNVLRPMPAFGIFIANASAKSGNFEVLTTSEPDSARVAAYRTLYHPATQFPPAQVGDVRLSFQNGAWKVDRHLVQV